MIKMNSKKIFPAFIILGLIFSVKVFAVNNSGAGTPGSSSVADKKAAREETKVQNMCERISDLNQKFEQKTSQQENRVRTRQEERLQTWSEKSGKIEANLEVSRKNWDENRDKQFSRLEERAQTEKQKQTVSDFEVAVKDAVATRRTTVDTAKDTFQEELKKIIETRQGEIESLVASSKSKRQSALEIAKNACAENGANAETVRTALRNSLQATRTAIQTDKQNVTKIGTSVQSLIQSRRTKIEKAMSDFKAAMEQARIQLKKAFPDDTVSAE